MDAWKADASYTNLSKLDEYAEQYSYDPNGNILSLNRNGTTGQLAMDQMAYQYERNANGQLTSNKLRYVFDGIPASNYPTDIDNQTSFTSAAQVNADNNSAQSSDNYQYDAIGNMVHDEQGKINSVAWTVYGKIDHLTKKDGTTVQYTYDASGNRISKIANGVETWYVRDATGNVMATYTKGDVSINSGNLTQAEVDLYGSSRLGLLNTSVNCSNSNQGPIALGNAWDATYNRGQKLFELTNHLGNVLATVTDRLVPVPDASGATIDYNLADVASANDYYSYGMPMPGRTYSATTPYRYGFNGKENDKDISEGAQDYGMRVYDNRLGRFFSVDNLFKISPELTPYRFAANNPIRYVDRDGDYETDGHYWTVYMVGLMIGLDKTTAERLATLAERPDNYVHKGHKAMEQRYTWSNADMQKNTHSLIGSKGNVEQNILFAVHQLSLASNDNELSTALHYFGDAFAHQRMDGIGYYGDRGSKRTFLGKIFELFKKGSSEHSEHIDENGEKVGGKPDLIYNRPSLYFRYAHKLAETLSSKYGVSKNLDLSMMNKMVKYATENKVSLIGIINYEVAKLKGESTFFVAKDPGMAPDNYSLYIENTKKYLESQGIKYTTEVISSLKDVKAGNDGFYEGKTTEEGTKFNIKQ